MKQQKHLWIFAILFLVLAVNVSADTIIRNLGTSTTDNNVNWVGNGALSTFYNFSNTNGTYPLSNIEFLITEVTSSGSNFTVVLYSNGVNAPNTQNPLAISQTNFTTALSINTKYNASFGNYVLQNNTIYWIGFIPLQNVSGFYRIGEVTTGGPNIGKYCVSLINTTTFNSSCTTFNNYISSVTNITINLWTSTGSSISFSNPTPSNNSAQYYTNNNNITINTSVSNAGTNINTTQYVYYENGSLYQSINNLSENVSNSFNNLAVGRYYFNATFSNGTISNTTETRILTIYNITPSSVTIPSNNSNITRYLTINWTNATTTNSSVTINNFRIYLDNTLLNTTTLLNNLNYDIYYNNLSIGTHNITIEANDSNGNKINSTYIYFNHYTNALLNITAVNTSNILVSSFNASINGVNYSTSNGFITFDGVKTTTYSINISSAYSSYLASRSVLLENFTQLVNFTLYPTRTINVTIRDAITQQLVNQNITLTITNANASIYYVTTGNRLFTNLNLGDTEFKFIGANYSEARYNINITSDTYADLVVYLSSNAVTQNVTFTIYNVYGAIVEGAYMSQYVLSNVSYLLTMDGYSDISGKLYFSYNPNYYYLYNITHPDYIGSEFVLNPPRESNYDITLLSVTAAQTYSLPDIDINSTFNNVTNVLDLNYYSRDNVSEFTFWVYNKGVKVCDDSSNNLTDSFSCNLTSRTGYNYYYLLADGINIFGGSVQVAEDSLADYVSVSEASFWSGIIFLLISFAGASIGVIVSILFAVAALTIIIWLGVFNGLSIAILSVALIMGLIVGFVIRRYR